MTTIFNRLSTPSRNKRGHTITPAIEALHEVLRYSDEIRARDVRDISRDLGFRLTQIPEYDPSPPSRTYAWNAVRRAQKLLDEALDRPFQDPEERLREALKWLNRAHTHMLKKD